MNTRDKFIKIDEEGYFFFDEIRVTDTDVGRTLFKNLNLIESGHVVTELDGQSVIVEAFDEPFVALQIDLQNQTSFVQMPYDYKEEFLLETLTLDEWDRFHGHTKRGIPFVLSRPAQAEFFKKLEDYDDESITWNGKKIEVKAWLPDSENVQEEKFWTGRYLSNDAPWDLKATSPALKTMLPKLKLPKSRILVLGCGTGHDAAYFAEQGHLVKAVDMSPTAIEEAKKLYGHLPNLEFTCADFFKLPADFNNSFDLVFEYTCYCAINPILRNKLVQAWKRFLDNNGHLFAVFFTMERRFAPPFGGSEWEIRQRLKKDFQFLYWKRWRDSIPGRQGKELFVYARKLSRF
ncbi:MAG: methyltransferase domain-containing protein [Pseudobdellovibrionaceae bacterium]